MKAERLDRDELVADEKRLRDFFGLLIQAHYRTTPADVQLLLDGPNVALHAISENECLVAATMVALEGALPDAVTSDLYWGRTRLRGHALPETLISHSGRLDAGPLVMLRSVRIAVHPQRRRLGYATSLVEHIHQHYQPDLFGTLFGTTAGLLTFRRHLGYVLVRVGASPGTRTGEPAAVMIHPVSPIALIDWLENSAEISLGNCPSQLRLMEAGHELVLDDDLRVSLGLWIT